MLCHSIPHCWIVFDTAVESPLAGYDGPMLRSDVYQALHELGRIARAAGSMILRWISPRQRDSLLATSGLAHRIVWSVPEDALAEGWTTQGDEADEEDLDDLDDALRLENVLLTAAGSARADGGAWLWVVIAGDMDFTSELGDGPHEVAAVHPVCREELHIERWDTNLESARYGRPELVVIQMQRDGLGAPAERVHASRLIYVPGMRTLPTQETRDQGYDLAALQVYHPAIDDLEKSWSSGATLVERLSMPQLTIADANSKTGDKMGWLERMKVMARSMTTKGLMVLIGTDTLTWSGPSVAGYADLLRSLAERLSAVEGIPLSRLLGQAPAGLTSDDASGTRTYYDLIERYRRTVLRPAILDVYRIARGNAKRKIVWPTLDKPSRLEKAQVSLTLAQRDGVLIQSGVIGQDESRARFEGEGELDEPVLDEDFDLAREEPGEPDMPPQLPGVAPVPAVNAEPDEDEEPEPSGAA